MICENSVRNKNPASCTGPCVCVCVCVCVCGVDVFVCAKIQ